MVKFRSDQFSQEPSEDFLRRIRWEVAGVPLYEYRCLQCAHQFERLGSRGEAVSCPECGHTELKRLFGTFGIKDPGKYFDPKKMARLADQQKRPRED